MIDQSGPDYYPTPPWGTRVLTSREKFQGSICDPCAGELHIIRELQWRGYSNVAHYDLIDYGVNSKICDFRDIKEVFDNTITNPPFKLAEALLMHLFKITNKKICLFLKMSFLESTGRYERLWSQGLLPDRVHVFTERISLYPGGIRGDLEAGTMMHGWFVWERIPGGFGWKNPNDFVKVRFIEPGFKDD